MSPLRSARIVFAKELVDGLRDRRTAAAVLVSAVLVGPLVLVAVSTLVASLEARAESRRIVVLQPERVPSLVNYFERQTYHVEPAPADHEARLRNGSLGDAVVVAGADFEPALRRGDAPAVDVVYDSANSRSVASSGRALQLLAGFGRERATLALALRGVAARLLEPLRPRERDLASTRTRATQVTGMLPFFVIMAVLYGALTAAIDTTAGERERGSLEPLLMNPVERWALALGKWAAVASVSMLIAVLSAFSFLPGQWLLRGDTLAALFQYGAREALLFVAVLVPFAAALSAVLMAVAIRCRSLKEAQASTSIVVLVASLLPLVNVFSIEGEAPWHVWVPALAQNTLLTHVLKGDAFDAAQLGVPLGVCAVLTGLGVGLVARALRGAALR